MEIQNQKIQQHFFITIKRVGKRLPRMSDYNTYFNKLEKIPEFIDIISVLHDVFEIDKNKRIHYHGIYTVDLRFPMTESDIFNIFNIFKTNWHINVRECLTRQDVENCFSYMRKDEVKEFYEHVKQGHFAFVDNKSLTTTKSLTYTDSLNEF